MNIDYGHLEEPNYWQKKVIQARLDERYEEIGKPEKFLWVNMEEKQQAKSPLSKIADFSNNNE
jgi:hypothetical protein